jgi:hypothetical protein
MSPNWVATARHVITARAAAPKFRDDARRDPMLKVGSKTKIAQGWPKLRANFRALVWIFSQSVGPSLAIWANPVQFLFKTRRNSCASVPMRTIDLIDCPAVSMCALVGKSWPR